MKEKRRRAFDVTTGYKTSSKEAGDPIEREIRAEDREIADDARRLRLEIAVQRRKNALAELKGKQVTKKEIANTGNTILQGIMDMGKVDPARAKEFLASLSQEDILKINMFSSSGSGGNMMPFLPLLQNKDTKIQDIVAVVKMMQPAPDKPTTIAEVATLMKALREDKPQPQSNVYEKLVTSMLAEAKATREEQTKDRMLRYEKELAEHKNRPTFAQELAAKKAEMEAYKDTFGGGTGENLEITKMRMGQKRWEMEETWKRSKEMAELTQQKRSDKEKLDLIKAIALPAIDKLGPVLADAVNIGKQHTNGSPGARKVSAKQAATSFLCTECAKNNIETIINVKDMPDVAICPTCKKEFPKQQM